MLYSLDTPPFANRTGAGITVAVVDSGIHTPHPHIGAVSGGANLTGGAPGDVADRIGHGTAVAAAIREKSPGANLLAVRIFDRQLSTDARTLADAIDWSAEHGAQIINLSLGTANTARAEILTAAIERARAAGAIVVSARESEGVTWLPGSLPGVAAIEVDWACDRNQLEITLGATGMPVFRASGYPRPIPGIPPERNLSGISFAVANTSGFLARAFEARGENPAQRATVWHQLGLDHLLPPTSKS